MGTLVYYTFFTKKFDYGDNEGLNKFGRILKFCLVSFMTLIMLVVMLPFFIVENIFILPAYFINNLIKDKKCSYKQFLERIGE